MWHCFLAQVCATKWSSFFIAICDPALDSKRTLPLPFQVQRPLDAEAVTQLKFGGLLACAGGSFQMLHFKLTLCTEFQCRIEKGPLLVFRV